MASEWPTVSLGELCTRITKGTTPNTLGLTFQDRGVNFVKSQAITDDGRIDASTFAFINPRTHKALGRSILQEGDVLFSMAGVYLGKTAVVPGSILPANTNQAVGIIRLDQARAVPRFIHYALSSPECRALVRRSVAQSAQPNYNLRDIGNLPVPLPSLSEQRAIAHILGTLDDKIELNRRMNETLEAMARALFKSWFVDTTQAGLPKGWRESTIGQICEFAYGKSLKEEMRRPGSIPVYGSNGQVGWHDEALVKGPGIVVGRKGNPGIVTWSATDFFPIDTTFYVVPKGECRSLYFFYYALRAHDLASLGADSAVPGLNRNMAYLSQQVVPPPAVLGAFDAFVRPLYEKIHANDDESRTLAALRDALLPKLLSGELRVKDAERFLTERGL